MKIISICRNCIKRSFFSNLLPIQLKSSVLGWMVIMSLSLLLTGCNNEEADSPSVITGDSKITYAGVYSVEVNRLLSLTKPWATPTTDGGTDYVIPRLFINGCLRDGYVQAAIAYAYGAEYRWRFGKNQEAEEYAKKVKQSLDDAQKLCSTSTSVCGDCNCTTKDIWPCSAVTTGPPLSTTPITTTTTTPTGGSFDFTLDGKKLDLSLINVDSDNSSNGYARLYLLGKNSNLSLGTRANYDLINMQFDKSEHPTSNFGQNSQLLADGQSITSSFARPNKTFDADRVTQSHHERIVVFYQIALDRQPGDPQDNWSTYFYKGKNGGGFTDTFIPTGFYMVKRTGNIYEITIDVTVRLNYDGDPKNPFGNPYLGRISTLKGTYKGPIPLN